jgi:hypothetical protein
MKTAPMVQATGLELAPPHGAGGALENSWVPALHIKKKKKKKKKKKTKKKPKKKKKKKKNKPKKKKNKEGVGHNKN